VIELNSVTRQCTLTRSSASTKLGVNFGQAEASSGPLGVECTTLIPDGIAAQAGMMVGDMLVSINGKVCQTLQEANKLFSGATGDIRLVLQSAPFDHSLVSELVHRGETPAEEIFAAHLGKLAPVEADAAGFGRAYASLLEEVGALNEAFTAGRISSNEQQFKERENFLKALNSAVEAHGKLTAQVQPAGVEPAAA
jgi:hypothetical protein